MAIGDSAEISAFLPLRQPQRYDTVYRSLIAVLSIQTATMPLRSKEPQARWSPSRGYAGLSPLLSPRDTSHWYRNHTKRLPISPKFQRAEIAHPFAIETLDPSYHCRTPDGSLHKTQHNWPSRNMKHGIKGCLAGVSQTQKLAAGFLITSRCHEQSTARPHKDTV